MAEDDGNFNILYVSSGKHSGLVESTAASKREGLDGGPLMCGHPNEIVLVLSPDPPVFIPQSKNLV